MDFTNKKLLILASVLLVVLVVLIVILKYIFSTTTQPEQVSSSTSSDVSMSTAVASGQALTQGKCTGEGPIELTALPMNPEDFSILIPYGLVIGGHVTPIDHQYFSPTIFNSPRDTYDVMATADGRIVDVQPRARTNPNDPSDKFSEYRIVFSHTCTFLTYFDLVTSLAPDLQAEYDRVKNSDGYAGNIDFKVTSGQIIGKIGGQTLDFAVWDTQKPLTGFAIPEHYEAEAWKIFTANPNDYFTEELAQILIDKNPRTIEPIHGKIDYDIAGKLIGNWFLQNSGGYGGNREQGVDYWQGHLSIAPDHYDPAGIIFSIGDFEGEAKQFLVHTPEFAPESIGVDSGLQKIEIGSYSYLTKDGTRWDSSSLIKSPRISANLPAPAHCVLLELTESMSLKLELFPATPCSAIQAFTSNSRTYER